MELSRLDSNKYKAILRFKQKNAERIKSLGYAINPNEKLRERRGIDKYGELAVRRLKQPSHIEFSDSEVNQIISAYQSGSSTIELGKQFHCCKNTINGLLKQHGIEVTKAKAQAKINADTVIAMYAKMQTIETIAKHFGVSSAAIRKCLCGNGIKLRSRWDYPRK